MIGRKVLLRIALPAAFLIAAAGCAQADPEPFDAPTSVEAGTDRLAGMADDFQGNNITAVVDFIYDYNANQTEALQLTDYAIERDGNTVTVIGDKYGIFLHLDDEGNIMFGTCQGGDSAETETAVSEALMQTLSPAAFDTDAFKTELALRQMDNQDMPEELYGDSELRGEIGMGTGQYDLNAELDDSEKPMPEMPQKSDLKEPVADRPVGAITNPEDLPDIGNFGKVPGAPEQTPEPPKITMPANN